MAYQFLIGKQMWIAGLQSKATLYMDIYGYNLVQVILMGPHFVKREMLVSPLELAAALDYHLDISSPDL